MTSKKPLSSGILDRGDQLRKDVSVRKWPLLTKEVPAHRSIFVTYLICICMLRECAEITSLSGVLSCSVKLTEVVFARSLIKKGIKGIKSMSRHSLKQGFVLAASSALLLVALLSTSAFAAQGTNRNKKLGGLDIDGYCQSIGDSSASLDDNTGYD